MAWVRGRLREIDFNIKSFEPGQRRNSGREINPERGILKRERFVRWAADKSSFGNPGNGMTRTTGDLEELGPIHPKTNRDLTGAVSHLL